MGNKLKFPTPANCRPADPAVLCSAERVLGLYNQANADEATRIAKKVKTWFRNEAYKIGWAGVHFLPDVQSKHGAGCVLWIPPTRTDVQITVTTNMLVLREDDGDDGEQGDAAGRPLRGRR